MGKYGKARRKEAARDTRIFNAEEERRNVYTPPPRVECDVYEYSYVLEEDNSLQITVRVWHQKQSMTEFHAVVEQIKDNEVVANVASMDCKNHGSIHMHDEIKDPDHENYKSVYAINNAKDVDAYFNRAIDELVDYAVSIAGTRR